MRAHVARTRDRDLYVLGLDCTGIHTARTRDVILRRLRPARALDAARARDFQLEGLHIHGSNDDSAGAGDGPVEALAGDLVDADVARPGDRSPGQLRHGHREGCLAAVRPTDVEEAAVVLGMDDELVAFHLDDGLLEELL